MRILIFTPTWLDESGHEAIKPECETAIKSQALRDSDEFDWHVTTDNPFPIGSHANVLHQYQRAREYFLHGDWEALLTIEHDNVLPDRDAVQRLLDTSGEVVYAPYVLRHGKPMLSTWQYSGDRNLGMSLSNHPRELRMARKNVIWRVCGAGMGCTLFRRSALERIPFEASTPRNQCPDLGFAEKALRAGLLSNARMDVPVWHYSNGVWLHPFEEHRTMKYLASTTVNAASCGRFIHLVAGQEVDLTDDEAQDLGRCGYIVVGAASPQRTLEPELDIPAPAALAQKRGRPRREASA